MSALAACLAWTRAHAAFVQALDDRLGRHHGLGWFELGLCEVLAAAPDGLPLARLAQAVHVPASTVLRTLLGLEKVGWVERVGDGAGRRIRLRPAGRSAHAVARETADDLCRRTLPAQAEVELVERMAARLGAANGATT